MTIAEFVAIDWDTYHPGEFVDMNIWQSILPNLTEVVTILKEEYDILYLKKDKVPLLMANEVVKYFNVLMKIIENLKSPRLQQDSADAHTRRQSSHLEKLREITTQMVNASDKYSNFYTALAIIKSYGSDLSDLQKVKNDYLNAINEYKSEATETINAISQRFDSIYNSSTAILDELSKKAAEEVTSSYATIFETQAKTHKDAARLWIVIAGITSIFFIFFLILLSHYSWFPTEKDIPIKEGIAVKYLLSNIFARVLIYAISIYFIGFSFKQFSINKHLSTINKHRQNGFDSYKLFAGSMIGDDVESRNSLLLQLAKAIYDQSSTGYIGDKDAGNISSSIIEITKMMRSNNT